LRSIIALIRFVVYSNIFVAICSVALTHLTYLLLDLPKIKNAPVLLFVFCSTYFTYNIQRIVRLNYQELIGKNIGIRLGWIVRNRSFLLSSSFLALLTSGCCLPYIKSSNLLVLTPLGILSIIYITPFFPYKGKMLSLRKLPFVKIFIISTVWSLVTVLFPYINEYGLNHFNDLNFQLVLLGRFIFIFAITLPFDIRDLKLDKVRKIATIPSAIGKNATIMVSEILLIIYAGIIYWQCFELHLLTHNQFTSFMYSIAISMIIIAFSIKRRPELYFSFLVEGTMLILHFGILVLEY